MTMNQELAQFYGTPGVTDEDQEKLASVETFAKLAARHGIDLTQMADDEVDALYAEVYPDFAKTAQEEEKKKKDDDDDDDEEEKKESAAQHFQEKVAFQEKFAEADFMGRVMAHSFTQERDNIEKQAVAGGTKTMSAVKTMIGGHGKVLAGPSLRGKLKAVGERLKHHAGALPGKAREAGKKGYEFAKEHKGAIGAGAGGAALLGAGGYAVGKKKKASADFEELSANQAIKIASAGGYDDDQAFTLVSSIYNLGLEETEKVANVQDLDSAIHIRGLEYLEAAGYDVNWSEIFGD